MSNSDLEACPLCHSATTIRHCADRRREYWRCAVCLLIHVPRRFHLTAAEERQRYDSHKNSPDDPAYRDFLNRLVAPLLTYLKPGQQGLDFGCGPGPTLSLMLQEQGYDMSEYDPFYADNPAVLQRQYEFITCSEAIEHFTLPDDGWHRLLSLLADGGILAIMTQLHRPETDFDSWYYKNDATHIHFFSRHTFAWLAERDGFEVTFYGESVIILKQDLGLRTKLE